MPRVYVISNECQKRYIDSERIKRIFSDNGWEISTQARKSDYIYVGTCAFTGYMEDKSARLIKKMLKKNNKAQILVGGCLPDINRQRLDGLKSGLQYVSSENIKVTKDNVRCGELVKMQSFGSESRPFIEREGFKESIGQRAYRYLFEFGMADALSQAGNILNRKIYGFRRSGQENRRVCLIEVSQGCLSRCSYCAVRFAAGSLKSRPLNDIISECRQRVSQGYSKIRLVASDNGCYGRDINSDFPQLLAGVTAIKGLEIIAVDDINAKWFIKYADRMIDVLKPFKGRTELKISIQSASDKVLKNMNRDYTAEQLSKAFLTLKNSLPQVEVTTSVIVGFPQETAQDFLLTKQFLKLMRFSRVFVFKYSDRKNTPSSRMKGKISGFIKWRRMLSLEIQQVFIMVKSVLWEKKKNPQPVCWEESARDNSGNPHIFPGLGRFKSQDFLRILNNWAKISAVKRMLKTDLREEAYGDDEILFSLDSSGPEIMAVDCAVNTVRQAVSNRIKRNIRQEYFAADVRDLPFTSGSFDLIVSTSTLDHFDHDSQLLGSLLELKRALSHEGRMILTFNNKHNLSFYLMDKLEQALKRKKYPVRFYSLAQLKRLCALAGLRILRTDRSVNVISPANTVLMLAEKFFGKTAADFLADKAVKTAKIFNRIPGIRDLTAWFIAVECVKNEND